MAKIIGSLPAAPRQNLLGAMLSKVNETARMKAEFESGVGAQRLAELAAKLPDPVTVVLRPTLGFMSIDCCIIGPGAVMPINSLHWKGKIIRGEQDAWIGQPTSVHLGRPDRRSFVFADRLRFSGLADGFALEPVVIVTGGKVDGEGLADAQATLVQWDDAAEFLARSFPPGVQGLHSPSELIKTISGK